MNKFIKVKNIYGKEMIVNLSNVSYFISNNENQTLICFVNSVDYAVVNLPLQVFEQKLNEIDDNHSLNVYDFT